MLRQPERNRYAKMKSFASNLSNRCYDCLSLSRIAIVEHICFECSHRNRIESSNKVLLEKANGIHNGNKSEGVVDGR